MGTIGSKLSAERKEYIAGYLERGLNELCAAHNLMWSYTPNSQTARALDFLIIKPLESLKRSFEASDTSPEPSYLASFEDTIKSGTSGLVENERESSTWKELQGTIHSLKRKLSAGVDAFKKQQ